MPLERKAREQEVLRESSHYSAHTGRRASSGQTVTAQGGGPHIPLRGSLLLIERHWSLLLSTARHNITLLKQGT